MQSSLRISEVKFGVVPPLSPLTAEATPSKRQRCAPETPTATPPPPLPPVTAQPSGPTPSPSITKSASLADLTDHATLHSMPLTIVIFGATGDLARKKLFPSLYQLCMQGHLPSHLNIVGYGRSPVDLPAFIAKQCVNIKENRRALRLEHFTSRIQFHAGGYDAPPSYQSLDLTIRAYEEAHPSGKPGNRLFFLSVPPAVFGTVAEMISQHARAERGAFTRLMIEKPFGRDLQTFHELNQLTARHFEETQLFRIDHYLGKEVLLNISTLRWANSVFEPLWTREHIHSVQITFKENLGTEGRGGYFDGVGIVRDVIQNHLLQAFMFLAMDAPQTMCASDIVEMKVALLRSVKCVELQHTFLGQFAAGNGEKGYLDDETTPAGSRCPTFAACVLSVDNERWRGVPFLLTAGKGLDERLCEVRVRFKPQPYNKMMGVDAHNELVMRVQPDEALYMVAVAKTPGISAGVGRDERRTPVAMGLRYASQFGDGSPFVSGDAYERMLLNAARGDQALSVSAAELFESWRIFTPMLHQIDQEKPQPVVHAFGELPAGFIEWTESHGIDISPPARHWSAAEAEAHAAAAIAAAKAAEEAAARARAEEAKQADPFSDPSFML
ncbi:hypothetical protein AB1Y20_002886 [Prymnesium parvum]|uniref:Glucose-6-phosphate 1-dehydrogenase n=1 Tax=Prymnesium parvum TaxID=97485 RepID=A0AB34JAV0_PRYPA